MDTRDELLTILLKCGYMDIDTLINVIEMGEELFGENLLYDVIEESDSEYLKDGFNPLIYDLMRMIAFRLVEELDAENESYTYMDILNDHWDGPFANCMDSHFQLDSLDGWSKEISKDELLKSLKLDLDWMNG